MDGRCVEDDKKSTKTNLIQQLRLGVAMADVHGATVVGHQSAAGEVVLISFHSSNHSESNSVRLKAVNSTQFP